MIALSRRKAARLLECVCLQRKCTPRSVLSSLPYRVCDDIIFTRIGNAYVLTTAPPMLPDASVYPYRIIVDNAPLFSQASAYNATLLAEQLCDVYPLARIIEVHHNDVRLFCWKQIAVGQWINTHA